MYLPTSIFNYYFFSPSEIVRYFPSPVDRGIIKEYTQGSQLLSVVKGNLEQDGDYCDPTLHQQGLKSPNQPSKLAVLKALKSKVKVKAQSLAKNHHPGV